MNQINKNIKLIFGVYFLLFTILIFNLLSFSIFESEYIITNSFNPRLRHDNDKIKRGYILDSNHVVLASSIFENEGYIRNYTYGSVLAHVIGHKDFGKTGLEARLNFDLQNLHNELFQRIRGIIFNHELIGNSAVLTIDSTLQNMIYKELDGQRGAVVVLEPSTGKILSMVSNPSYNPNTVLYDWEYLIRDIESPLINRSTQGLYPPGSVFKIATALSGINNLEEMQNHLHTCYGEVVFEDSTIRCFNNVAHGTINMKQAFAVSCNTYFAKIGNQMGAEKLRITAEQLYFNKNYRLPLNHNQSSFVLDGNSPESEIVTTSIGQGETLVTPIHMAMIVSAVANGGIMMQPYLLDYIITYNGREEKKHIPRSIDRIMTLEESQLIKEMMVSVVDEGTGVNARINSVQVAGKTGTAENSNDSHGWFVAFAPADNPEVVVSIIFENSHSAIQAIDLSRKIMEYIVI